MLLGTELAAFVTHMSKMSPCSLTPPGSWGVGAEWTTVVSVGTRLKGPEEEAPLEGNGEGRIEKAVVFFRDER